LFAYPPKKFLYRLHEIIIHAGDMKFGHYVNYVRRYANDNSEESQEETKSRME
jgi:ubiquitin C-terminal hydrolase